MKDSLRLMIKESENILEGEKDYNKIYPDTAEGALLAFKSLAKTPKYDLSNIKIKPDPEVQGVWLITFEKFNKNTNSNSVIVYMRGYKEPGGEIRQYNDYEDVTDPKGPQLETDKVNSTSNISIVYDTGSEVEIKGITGTVIEHDIHWKDHGDEVIDSVDYRIRKDYGQAEWVTVSDDKDVDCVGNCKTYIKL